MTVQGDGAGEDDLPALRFSEHVYMFKNSLLIDDGDIVRAKQVIERLGNQRMHILAGLRLYEP
jgi:hypothetical protein